MYEKRLVYFYKLQESSKKDGKGTCELNKHDISLTNENNTFLHDEIGVTLALLLRVNYIELVLSELLRIAPVLLRSTF